MPSDPPAGPPPRVFISYSHDSGAHAERVRALADRLRADGVDAWIDQYETAPSQGWPRWMEDQLEQARFVLCVCTKTYRDRVDQKQEPGQGLGVTWEGALIRLGLYLAQGNNEKFLPVLFDSADEEHIPNPLRAFHRFELLDNEGYEALYRHLTDQPKTPAPPIGPRKPLDPLPRRSLFGDTVEPEPQDDPLTAYGQWAREHYSHLDLIGIDAGDVQVKLDEVYVPLRAAFRPGRENERLGMFRNARSLEEAERENEPVEIEHILRHHDPRHVLLFGEPGSGKTTALLKLHQLCWQGASALGLAEGTIPVFLRLRHFDKTLLDKGLAAFIDREVRQLSGGRHSDLGDTLWNHKKLLLLCDGLDEIADADHRAEVLRRIGWYLEETAEIRAVVSCRRVGLPGPEADRDRQFRTYEVRPLQDEQIAFLVKRWFRELARRERITQAVADTRVSTLLDALTDRQKSSQQILEMASNPLLLTLLCVVVLLGNEIPKKRVRFYEQCLDVLLDRWPRQKDKAAPVDLSTARDALGHLAFYLHAAGRRDDLGWAEALVELMKLLGEGNAAEDLFDWLHRDVGLLVDYTEEEYGFVHLGLQEHLTARHLVSNPGDLEFLDGDFNDTWWREVFLQLCALSERAGFHALTSHLLGSTDALEHRAGLLRECLRETSAPDLGAFLEVLNQDNEERQMAVLRVLSGFTFRPPELVETLETLKKGTHPAVAQTAERLLQSGEDERDQGAGEGVAVIYGSDAEAGLAQRLVSRLRNWRGGCVTEVFEGLGQKTGRRLKGFRAVLILVGSTDGDWSAAKPYRTLYQKKLWLIVPIPGVRRQAVPEIFSDCEVLDWRVDEDDALVEGIVERLEHEALREQPAMVPISRGLPLEGKGFEAGDAKPYTEPLTGTIFLPVPGGSFLMGGGSSLRVRLSPYWLAKTPVTNEQYGRFLTATRHEEPKTWRDRRFSDPAQPVVSVSWDDAVAYCKWLSANNPEGHRFELPSDAQWEFAARGTENRTYPWGETPPNDQLACYGQNPRVGKPKAVGSYPEGAGPFGHLDLAGLVWEWCRDAWEPDLSHWAGKDLLDPVGKNDPKSRPLRGGAWWRDADYLRPSIRRGGLSWDRGDTFGFRLLLCPPSLDS